MRRQHLVGLTIAGLLLGLSPLAAAGGGIPTCDGKQATIYAFPFLGTNGPDVIVASDANDLIQGGPGDDTICGRKGADTIQAGDGHDRVFGGRGADDIEGAGGRDELFGYRGHDYIKGRAGDDDINGGAGDDTCRQGAGSGTVTHCEKADLKVTITSPASAPAGITTFTVKVKNLGPDTTSYELILYEDDNAATCGDPPWDDDFIPFPALDAGATRSRTYSLTCTVDGAGAWVEVLADLIRHAHDPDFDNNLRSSRTELFLAAH
jgi:Ca2+-binding RTX toxin-like protein